MSASAGKPGTIVFDLDGTLCTNTFGEYEKAEPDPVAIARVNRLAGQGHRIVVFTARGSATGIDWSEMTRDQLGRWGLRYDELHFGKPSADVFVDDRAVHTSSWLRGDAFVAPGHPLSAGEGLPPAPPPASTALTAVGRTFGGRPLRLDRDAEWAAEQAAAAGLGSLPPAEISAAVAARIAAVEIAPPDDLLYTIAISAPEEQVVDLARPVAAIERPRAALHVGLRPLSELAHGGAVEIYGANLAIAVGASLMLEPASGPAGAATAWIAEIAAGAGIDVETAEIEPDRLTGSEAILTGLPHVLLPLAAAGGRELAGESGAVATRLLAELRAATGIDALAQLRELAG